jgi:hypothetical protein
MTVDQGLAVVAAPDATESHEPYSVAWWETRTAEDLRDIVNRGFASGQAFRGAIAETERRARQETRRLREVAAAEALSRRKRNEIFWGVAASVLAIAALLGFWLAR